MSDTKSSTEKLKLSQKTTKLSTGKFGYYKGTRAEIKTTRVFFEDKTTKTKQRGVELIVDMPLEEARKSFKNSYSVGYPEIRSVIVFVDILDFRKNFVYSETASLFYGKL